MSFNYTAPIPQTVYTEPGRALYVKSFKIDIAAGAGFTTAVEYPLGFLPRGSQVVTGNVVVSTAVSGGTVSAATITIKTGGYQIGSLMNVFSSATVTMGPTSYYTNTGWAGATDELITYTPTLTGSGATAGVMYINIFYVA